MAADDKNHAPAATPAQFMALVQSRRSCRRYAASRPVPRELIDQCVEAARLAPSACNRQPWRFVIADEPALVARFRAEAKRTGIPHPWWEQVPVFVALCARLDLVTHTVAPLFSGIPYYLIDLGIAGEHFALTAEALGLRTCWIGWFDERAVRRLLGLPRGLRVAALITLGWPAPDDSPSAPRSPRLDLTEIRRWNCWE